MSKFSISTSTWSISVETTDDGGGTIVSRGLHGDADYYRGVGGADYEAKPYEVAIDVLESIVLAHACSGVNIEAPEYVKGISDAVDAIVEQCS